ncbi:putative The fantastic four family protein [Dioscorea sansibarensis]
MAVVVCGVTPAFAAAAFPVNQQSTGGDGSDDGRLDIWNSIQSQKAVEFPALPPYVHPLIRRSSSSLSQKSLQVCTESLCSETGFDVFSDDDFSHSPFSSDLDEIEQLTNFEDDEVEKEEEEEEEEAEEEREEKELVSVNYHCCISRRSPVRSFPPPLPSISRRDGSCLSMRPHRRGGRLVVEAVPVPSQNYLHAERHDGRLLLSFIRTSSPQPALPSPYLIQEPRPPQQEDEYEDEYEYEYEVEDEDGEEESEEEEVEVVDRGTVVEVKVSMQPQQQSGSMKVHRSTLVINKFVSGTPISVEDEQEEPPKLRRVPSTTMTAAAAVVAAASSLRGGDSGSSMGNTTADSKLLFTSKGRSKGEVLHRIRRCSELRRPIFFWEPCCIVTN